MQARRLSVRWIVTAFVVAAAGWMPPSAATAPAAPDPAALARADSLYTSQAWPEAAAAYEPLVGELPQDGLRWYRYGTSLLQSGHPEDAVRALERAESIGHHPMTMYNLACAQAKLEHRDEAIDWLAKAAAAGFSQVGLLDSDADLEVLRSHARWSEVREAADKNARPCAYDPRYRELDFWIGDWDVKTPQGQPAGASHIELILSNCVIFENWTGFTGMSGKSFNFVDAVTREWRQTWVSDKGAVHEYTGEYRDRAMRYRRETKDADGAVTLHRMTLFDVEPGHVRQLGEQSVDGGATWTPQYDLHYYRKPVP